MAKKLARKKSSTKAKAKSPKPKAGPAKASAPKANKYVYFFGRKTDGNGTMKPLLGGKGANLAEMCRIGLPVPPGFTITTEVCTYYYANKRSYPPALRAQMEAGVASLEKQTGKTFGDLEDPLLVSVRSGARDSMPGMMDTILNLGLNDQTVEALAAKTGNPRFAWDCYRRFVQMYCDVVLGVQKRPDEDHEPFETVIHNFKHVIVAELNMGQLRAVIRDKFLVDAVGLNKIQGMPFKVREIIVAVDKQLEAPPANASSSQQIQVNA